MEFKPLLEAEEIQKKSRVMYASAFFTKRFGNFIIPIPDPVWLFLDMAEKSMIEAMSVAKELDKVNKTLMFGEDGEKEIYRDLDFDKLQEYLELLFSTVIYLITAIETFTNKTIPNNYSHSYYDNKGNKKNMNKSEIEKRLSVEDKISIVCRLRKVKGVKQTKFWTTFKKVKQIRDDLVHLKTKGDDNINMYDDIFINAFDLDMKLSLDHFIALVNYIEPKYFEA